MYYVRCHPNDYDQWANFTGDAEWKYENVLPFFKKSLDYNGAYGSNSKHYGQSAYGSLHVESRSWKPMHYEFMTAIKELGYEELDLNARQQSGNEEHSRLSFTDLAITYDYSFGKNLSVGFASLEVTQKNGYRWGTFPAFIEPILGRQNLHISRYSQATKVFSIHFTMLLPICLMQTTWLPDQIGQVWQSCRSLVRSPRSQTLCQSNKGDYRKWWSHRFTQTIDAFRNRTQRTLEIRRGKKFLRIHSVNVTHELFCLY